MSASDISYDGFLFSANGLVVEDENHMILPSRSNQLDKIAGRPGKKLVDSDIGEKSIPISGYYIGATIADAQNMYDTLAQVLNRVERPLIIPHGGGERRFIATIENAVMTEPDGLNKLTFSFEFVIPTGASSELVSEELFPENLISTPTTTIPLTVRGSQEARPEISIVVNSVTGGTAKSISIRNARDFVGLTIEGNFVSGDEITINSDTFQIYVNGTLTPPSGRMPKWSPGSGALYYSDTFSTRSVTINGTYIPNFQ